MGRVVKVLIFSLLLIIVSAHSKEPITPIPSKLAYDKNKALLGKMLFFDPVLSMDRSVSCASCHDFDHGGADPRPVSIGVNGQKGRVNSPTVYNAIFNFRQFWNGRAKDLKEQIHGPLHSSFEMNITKEEIEKRLNANAFYKKAFKKIYKKTKITYDQVIDVIVEFEKALITPDSRFDRYLKGEKNSLTEQEKRGYMLFKRLGCVTCHNGINVGGNSFQHIGTINFYEKSVIGDRFELTGREFDKKRFKVPSLRNVELTAPYFHDGSVKTLKEAVEKMTYYNLGTEVTEQDIEDIVAFLKTLTGKKPTILSDGHENR